MSGKLNKWTLGQLRIALDKMGQDTQGTKAVLIERLEGCLSEEVPPVEPDIKHCAIESSTNDAQAAEAAKIDFDNASSVSTVSSIVSERVRLAGLRARAAYLKKKHELDRQAQELQARQEALDLEIKIKEVTAREDALKAEEFQCIILGIISLNSLRRLH